MPAHVAVSIAEWVMIAFFQGLSFRILPAASAANISPEVIRPFEVGGSWSCRTVKLCSVADDGVKPREWVVLVATISQIFRTSDGISCSTRGEVDIHIAHVAHSGKYCGVFFDIGSSIELRLVL